MVTEIKITPERIYSMIFHPNPVKPIVFAGDKVGNLGMFDASQKGQTSVKKENEDDDSDEDTPEPEITSFKMHSRTITQLQFDPVDANQLYTSSHDGTVRKLDLTHGKSTEVFAPASASDDSPLSGCEVPHQSPNMIYVTTLNGAFGFRDMREPINAASAATTWYQLTDKKIGGFSLNPLNPHFVATASLDRTVCIYDLRKTKGSRDNRLPHLIGSHTSKLSISSANWNSANQLVTTSYDNSIKVYDFASTANSWQPGTTLSDKEMEPTVTIPHNNQTGRWITILRAQWQQQPVDGKYKMCIGNMNRFVDVYSSDGQQLAQLGDDAYITAVPAVAMFHPSNDWIVAGTASGKVCLWM
jgi:WD40 repeat protein